MDAFWSLTIPFTAVRADGADFLFQFLVLLAAVGLTLRLGRVVPWAPLRRGLILCVWALVFWGLRDRLHLNGDGQLWLQTLTRAGLSAPLYREPISVRLFGALVAALGPSAGTEVVMAAVSVLCGLVVIGGLLRLAELEGTADSALVAALAGALPFSLGFYGGVETGGPFLALLALTLVRLRFEIPAGRLRPVTLLLLALLPGFHITGLLLLPPLVLALRRAPVSGRVFALSLAALPIGGAAAAALLPLTRPESTFGGAWEPTSFGAYALDMVQGGILVALPVAPRLLGRGRLSGDRFDRFLGLAIPLLLCFPFIGRFRLGAFRDFNLFAPAGLLIVVAALTRPTVPGTRTRLFATLLAGSYGLAALAALLSFGHPPAGLDNFSRRLEQAPIAANDRAYGYETLALALRLQGRPAAAHVASRRALALDPSNDRLAGILGELDLQAGDTTAAVCHLERGLRSVRRREVSVLLARLDLERGRHRQAIDHLARGWADQAPDRRAGSLLAAAYLGVGAPDSALAITRLRLDGDPEDPAAWFNQGVALWALEGPAAAAPALRRARDLMPDNPVFRERLARVEATLTGTAVAK